MAATRTYKLRAVVLRKTKLGEKDLIITMLGENGELLRAVAKGARKPGGSLAARVELFSTLDCMLAKGKSLDVLAEARFAPQAASRSFDLEQSTCASSVAELLCTVAQEGLEHPRLFAMADASFATIASSSPAGALAVTAATLLKVLASAGFRPSLDTCVSCGNPLPAPVAGSWMSVSFEDGGVVCADCAIHANGVPVESTTVGWAKVLLYTTYSDIVALNVPTAASFSVLQFARQWARTHTGRDLKSLDFLFTSGLF